MIRNTNSLRALVPRFQHQPVCQFHASPACNKATAGRHKVSKMLNKPLTYDQAFKPNLIGVKKGWLSVHTGNLRGEQGSYQFTYEDELIRKFCVGTFYRMLPTDIVIKRRFNVIEITLLCNTVVTSKVLFLKAYSERLLSAFLKCHIKMHVFKLNNEDAIYKYI
uniref:28S ribosomal protein S24, mitochondrial n=1 Tax=Ciona intestinalis TaxID=7719 RepID=A0A1W2WNJ8_CIOIN|nr:28S ribosomal protein S24, mitochondrial [Ciona intestinalis]|eukprot:XP_002130889.1 28S ribosomal protein S24, mitochondrial [Ciona intestinalis]